MLTIGTKTSGTIDQKSGPRDGGKHVVVGAVRRKGNVVARVIENVSSRTLALFISEAGTAIKRC
jgi:hypothetical protein